MTSNVETLSPLCLSPVYRSRSIGALKSRVRVIYPWETDDASKRCVMRLTGIPPHVVHLAQMKQIQESMASMPPMILESIEKMLDDRTMSGTMSETRMRALIVEGQRHLMDEFRRTRAGNNGATNQQFEEINTAGGSMEDEMVRHQLWMHRGKFCCVPPLWKFPSCNVHTAYKIWHTQNTVTGQCAMIF